MCETLHVSTSGYYAWVDRAPSARQQANDALAERIHAAFTASDATYGMPRVRAQLRHDGVSASRRRSTCVTTQRDKRQPLIWSIASLWPLISTSCGWRT